MRPARTHDAGSRAEGDSSGTRTRSRSAELADRLSKRERRLDGREVVLVVRPRLRTVSSPSAVDNSESGSTGRTKRKL